MAGLEYKLLNIFGTEVDHRGLRTVDPENGVVVLRGTGSCRRRRSKSADRLCCAKGISKPPNNHMDFLHPGPKIAIVLNYFIEYKVICIGILFSAIKMRNE